MANYNPQKNDTNKAKLATSTSVGSISNLETVTSVNPASQTPNLGLEDTFPEVSEVMSPVSSTSTSQFLQAIPSLNQDQVVNSDQNTRTAADSFALSNFKNPAKITQLDQQMKHKQVFDDISMENEALNSKIDELTDLLPASLKEIDNKVVTKFKKPVKKITTGASKRPAFVVKLWEIINDSKNSDYIAWMPDGKSLQVLNIEKFVKLILPKYYKQSNFASFVRQLNMYGWHKIQDVTAGSMGQTQEVWQFENPNFIKGREDLLDNIVRKKKGDDDDTDVRKILEQLEQLKRNQLLITEDLRRVRRDNELLWKESFIARERHKIQSETLDKIMRFLASIYGNNTSNLIEQMNNSNPGDLVQFGGNQPHDDHYGYYNNANVHSNMKNSMSPYMNNAMMMSKQYQQHPQSQPYRYNNNYSGNQNENMSTSGMDGQFAQNLSRFPGTDSQGQYLGSRNHLMITNKANSNGSTPSSTKTPNELRMKNVDFEPSTTDNIDSSIREIPRGPENRNTDYKKYIQHIPDYVDTPRQFVEFSGPSLIHNNQRNVKNPQIESPSFEVPFDGRHDSYETGASPYNTLTSGNKSPAMNIPPNNRQRVNIGTTIDSIPMTESSGLPSSPGLSSSNNMSNAGNKPGELPNPVKTSEIMGNINSQLHKNQSALKQVNDWLTKYNDTPDTDIPPIDDFQVDDFLQQPLDVNVSGTPLDMTNVEQFMNTETPAVTPMLGMDDDLYIDKKRSSPDEILDGKNDLSDISLGQPAKKFKPA